MRMGGAWQQKELSELELKAGCRAWILEAALRPQAGDFVSLCGVYMLTRVWVFVGQRDIKCLPQLLSIPFLKQGSSLNLELADWA